MEPSDELRAEKRKTRELKKYLKQLVTASRVCLAGIDEVMTGPSTPERGKRIARLANALNYATDVADHFGLGTPLRKPKKGEVG